MKHRYRYLMIIILEIIVIVSLITLKIEANKDYAYIKQIDNNKVDLYVAKEENAKDDLVVSKVIKLKNDSKKEPVTKRFLANDDLVDIFELDYKHGGSLKEKDVLKVKAPASDQLYLLFRNAYPLVSLEEMGVKTVEEAYRALQLATWEVAYRTAEASYITEGSDIYSNRRFVGATHINQRVYNAADKLINFVENWNSASEDVQVWLHVYTNGVEAFRQKNNDNYIYGPFRYEITNAIPKEAIIKGVDENGKDVNITIYNEKGEKVEDFTTLNNQNFYIGLPKDVKEFYYSIEVFYYYLRVYIYTCNNYDYIARVYTTNNVIMDNFSIVNNS